jgi:dCMP deaminase
MHVTHGPCLECARSIINAGIIRVTYQTAYRLTAGVELLTQAGIDTVYIGQPK